MAIRFLIPTYLRRFTGGAAEVSVDVTPDEPCATVGDALAALCRRHPGVRDRVFTELAEVRQHVNVFLDGESIRYAAGLATPTRDGGEIAIIPAVSGG